MPRARKPAERDPSPPDTTRPSALTPLAESVARCLAEMEFRYDTDNDGTIRVPFQGKLVNAEVQISIPQDRRDLVFRLDLQVAVPQINEEQLLHAVEELNRHYCVAQLLFNEHRRTIEAYHAVYLADIEPTPAFILEQLRVVMHNHDVIHHTLADFLFNSYGPARIVQKARGFEEGLSMLWMAQEMREANGDDESHSA
jgi:hypothetical protein